MGREFRDDAEALQMAEGLVDMPGVHAPEAIGDKPEVVARFIAEMEKRGVKVTKEVSGS